MRIGPSNWRMVSIDTAGVPTGGKYGDVRRFARKAGKHGLKVCFSRLHHCFGIYTQFGLGKPTFQLLCKDKETGGPIPLCDKLLRCLVDVWNKDCRLGDDYIENALKDRTREMRREHMRTAYERWKLMKRDVKREAQHKLGKRTRPVSIIVPAGAN